MTKTTLTWRNNFDERQLKEIDFDQLYLLHFRHGTDGHNVRIVVAQLAHILDQVETTLTDLAQGGSQEAKDLLELLPLLKYVPKETT
jgi:hypothetical protein